MVSMSLYRVSARLTRKRLLDIDHLPRARLHESALPLPRPLQPVFCLDLPLPLEIAFIPREYFHGWDFAIVYPVVLFHVNHLHVVFERIERVRTRDVVDEEKSVGFEIRCGPETAVFFLPRGVGEHQVVGHAVYRARD